MKITKAAYGNKDTSVKPYWILSDATKIIKRENAETVEEAKIKIEKYLMEKINE